MSFKKLKMTWYFENRILIRRPEFLEREEDIIDWISHFSKEEIQPDGRRKLFAWDKKVNKWVRIILEKDQIHNIFYDRDFEGV